MEKSTFTSRRGGARPGSGRPKEEPSVKIRLKKSVHERWLQAKACGKFTDSTLADYLLGVADAYDSSVARCALVFNCHTLHSRLKRKRAW